MCEIRLCSQSLTFLHCLREKEDLSYSEKCKRTMPRRDVRGLWQLVPGAASLLEFWPFTLCLLHRMRAQESGSVEEGFSLIAGKTILFIHSGHQHHSPRLQPRVPPRNGALSWSHWAACTGPSTTRACPLSFVLTSVTSWKPSIRLFTSGVFASAACFRALHSCLLPEENARDFYKPCDEVKSFSPSLRGSSLLLHSGERVRLLAAVLWAPHL